MGLILKGYNEARMTAFETGRMLNNDLSRLVAYSVNNPKKLPDYKPLKKRKQPEVSTEADEARVHAFFAGLATRA